MERVRAGLGLSLLCWGSPFAAGLCSRFSSGREGGRAGGQGENAAEVVSGSPVQRKGKSLCVAGAVLEGNLPLWRHATE